MNYLKIVISGYNDYILPVHIVIHGGSILFSNNCKCVYLEQDGKYHLFSSAKVVLEMIDLSIKYVENKSIRLKKLQLPHPRGYDDVMGFAYFLTSKVIELVIQFYSHTSLKNNLGFKRLYQRTSIIQLNWLLYLSHHLLLKHCRFFSRWLCMVTADLRPLCLVHGD